MALGSVAFVWLLAFVPALVHAATPAEVDWSVWRGMPVFYRGRMMPVNTFASTAVKKISGREKPTLTPPGAAGASAPLFPDGVPRRFAAAELLFSWLVEPERWEEVPFLLAEHEGLRREVLGLPVTDPQGNHLRLASPAQVRSALPTIRARLTASATRQQQAEAHGVPYVPGDLDRPLESLLESYTLYRALSWQPGTGDDRPARFTQRLNNLVETWNRISEELHGLSDPGAAGNTAERVSVAEDALEKLIQQANAEQFVLAETEPIVVRLREATRGLARQYADYRQRLFDDPPKEWGNAQLMRSRAAIQTVASAMADAAREANEALIALYDNGQALRLVPALDPAALEQKREEHDDAQPWLSVAAMLQGSPALLEGYPEDALERVRTAFAAVADAYRDRANPQRPEQFQAAMRQCAAEVRTLGEQLEPRRRALPLEQRDDALLAVTAYPGPEATRAEVHYFQFAPFMWSWVVGAVALGCFGLAFGVLRRPMFWLGLVVLLASQGLAIYGFALRVSITGWAPVTNMFETVMFVALVVSMLGAAFVLGPLLLPGLRHAWRLTALPYSWEARELGDAELRLLEAATWRRWGLTLLVPRVLMSGGAVWWMLGPSYGSGSGFHLGYLLPRTTTANDLLVWGLWMLLRAAVIWYVPRLVLAALSALILVPRTWIREGLRRPLEQALAHKPFAIAGGAVGLMTTLIACFAPIFDESIKPLMPVLRSNLWLTVHVLTITASYGAGALAWGLGNLSLGYYLLGRYETPESQGGTRRPPKECESLGSFIYKSMQVAVLLLAAGTILGGLWADVSWGRFWGWDAKEVWALVSLLIYLAVLHGRYAGWFGNFGLAVGSVLGATAIVMAWYGVNFWLGSGLHSYGQGDGGGVYVLAAVVLNWLLIFPPALRYLMETTPRP